MSGHLLDDRGDLLGRVDLGQLFDEFGLPAKNKMRGCPSPAHPQTGASPPASLDVDAGLWCCHGCQAGGTAIDLVALAKGLSTAEAFAWLRDWAGLHRPEPRPLPARRRPVTERPPPANADRLLAGFCHGRGWRLDVAQRCGLRVVTDRRGHPRLRIPYRWEGNEEWWQDRTIENRLPKFDSPDGKTSTVWAVDLAHGLACAAAMGQAIVVEGPTDGIALAHIADPDGYSAVFGLPGTGSSGALIGRLDTALAGLEVVVLVDEDEAGEKFRARLHQQLASAGSIVDVRVPPGCGDIDGWRRHLDHDDDVLADAIAQQVAAAAVERAGR